MSAEEHGHWVWGGPEHGQVWCDAPDCEPLADDQHPHWKAREAMVRAPLRRDEVEMLALYNAERARGLVHTELWQGLMAALQSRFDTAGAS